MRIKFSCVLEYSPLMAVQTYIWLTNILSIGIEPGNIYVHLINEIPYGFLQYLKSQKVNLIKKESFDTRNKYCNKLVQLETFVENDDYDYVFLMDCDTAVVDLNGLELTEPVYAKIVDFPNPPLSILQEIFKENNFIVSEYETTFPINGERVTNWNNCNGGVYIISREFLSKLVKPWKQYSLWCIENANLFGEKYDKHADQIGFAMAMASLDKQVSHLEVEWNYPIHVKSELNISPKIIHYHDAINEHMQLKHSGLPKVDATIRLVNERVSNALSKLLNNSMFWDFRYQSCPDLGSGIGSRGETLSFKKRMISYLTFGFNNKSIADVGCGDLELMKDFDFKNYTGLDVSSEALKIAESKRPDWNFKNLSVTDNELENTDLIMCFDVLIHQSNAVEFRNMVKSMAEKANERIIIGAYNSRPEYSSTITHFHNGILEEVSKHQLFDELAIVSTYRDISVVVGSKYKNGHSRDIGPDNINKAFKEVNRPDLLRYIVDVSRHHLGFYTSHYPRVFEYTWLLEQFEGKSNLKVLDIGAGVCPLPLCLSKMGMEVTTVDSHATVRLQMDKEDWNEWGFLDYSTIDNKIESKHINFTGYKTLKKYDCIYSVSVIEHMPKSVRQKVLKKSAKLLKKGGRLLLSVDVVPGTDDIWNLSENKEVEPLDDHGTIDTLKEELESNGFEIEEATIQRNIANSRTDVLYIKAQLKRKKLF